MNVNLASIKVSLVAYHYHSHLVMLGHNNENLVELLPTACIPLLLICFPAYSTFFEVTALTGHEGPVSKSYEETEKKVATPMSDVVCEDFHEFIEYVKGHMAPVDADLKDAKRRISAAKPKQKKAKAKKDDSDDSDAD